MSQKITRHNRFCRLPVKTLETRKECLAKTGFYVYFFVIHGILSHTAEPVILLCSVCVVSGV